jgi:ribosomal protein S18 acetylase RimI-like enzyme
MKIAVRIAMEEDRAAIWSLYESAMKRHIESIWGWDQAWQIAYFEQAFSASSTFVVEIDAQFGGYLQLDLGEREVYLSMIILTPVARSRRIGAKLLAQLNTVSQQAGLTLRLRVFRINVAARRFYEREGWRVNGEDDVAFSMTHPLGEDAGYTTNWRDLRPFDFVTAVNGDD